MQLEKMSFHEWMKFGIEQGWCGPPVCITHDGLPSTPEEDNQQINGDDPCVHIIRMYEDDEQKRQVEEYHSPSTWRDSYSRD